MISSLKFAFLPFAALAASVLSAETLTRGPYLQLGTPSAVTVRWRSSAATDSIVRYGLSASSLSQVVKTSASTTEHEIRLSGLAANTTYYYSVGSSATTLASGSGCVFVTAPTSPRPIRIWAIGDSGMRTAGQSAVRDAYYQFTGTRHTDFWLMLGDNAYMNGTDAQYQSGLFNYYPTMLRRSVVWPTFGNHDAESADAATQTGPYFNWVTLPKNAEAGGVASGTEAYYSFDYANVHVLCLDSSESSTASTGAMAAWLKRDLAANTREWTLAYWHHAPYSKGSHDSDTDPRMAAMRRDIVPLLEAHGVDLVLGGHSHAYERSRFINGHYGTASTFAASMIVQPGDGRVDGDGAYRKDSTTPEPYSGTVYVVAGSSANAERGTGQLNHPAMAKSLCVLGSVVIDVAGDQLDVQFIDNAGARRDSFTIRKGTGSTPPPPPATDDPGTPTGSSVVSSFSLINADTDQPIAGYAAIPNGAIISRASLPTTHLNVRVNTRPATVGSVRLDFDRKTGYRTESQAPYALFGDTNGNFNAGTLAAGLHTLTATPFSGAGGTGAAGTSLTMSFTVE